MLVFDNVATSKFDDVLFEHSGLPHVLPLAVHLKFFGWTSGVICWTPHSCLKVKGRVVAYSILVSAPVPIGFRFY